MKNFTITKKILIPILTLAFLLLPLFSAFSSSSFDQRKQAWLDRDGKSVIGNRYFFELPSRGRPYIFAWLEKGKYFKKGPKGLGSLHEQIFGKEGNPKSGLIGWIGAAGSVAGLNLMHILYQYKDILQGKVCPNGNCYPYPDDWDKINSAFYNLSRSETLISRTGTVGQSCSTQPTRTILAYLYTLEDKEAEFKCGQYGLCSKDWTSPYSGKTYRIAGIYNSHEYARDALYNFFDQCILKGNNELDGSYTPITIQGLLALYDFAGRPLARLNGQSDPEGLEMKKRAKMMLDFILLEEGMDSSAGHHGGALGRTYQNNIIKGGQHSPFFYSLLGLTPNWYSELVGSVAYVSGYRPPSLLIDVVNTDNKSDNYWHVHKENNYVSNQKGDTGKWTYVTRNYNLGGTQSPTPNWQLTVESGSKLLRIWINRADDSATHCPGNWMSSCNMLWGLGAGGFYQYRNALFSEISNPHLHIVQGEKFDYGQKNLHIVKSEICKDRYGNILKQGSCDGDYYLSPGWNFFRKGKVAIALNIRDRAQALEVVTIGVDYNSFDDFQNAVLGKNGYIGAELFSHYFKTSKGDIITDTRKSGVVGGTVNNKPIWNFPFPRMETIYGYGDKTAGKLITWNNKVMTVAKNDLTCRYDFNNWTYSGNGCGGGSGNYLADFNCDGKVNVQDLGILLSHWNQTKNLDNYQHPHCPKAKSLDLNANQRIDAGDFGSLLSCWGNPSKSRCLAR